MDEEDPYMYPTAKGGSISVEDLLDSVINNKKFVEYTMNLIDDYDEEEYGNVYIKIPTKFLLQENFNWKDCCLDIKGVGECICCENLNIELSLPKGKDVINDI